MNISHAYIEKNARTTAVVMAVALVVYVLCAWNSTGYLHPDEHFLIVEFACHKLGINSSQAMAWEYAEQIRPTLQPVLAMGLIKGTDFLGCHNPFTQTFILRLAAAILMLLAIKAFVDAAGDEVKHRPFLLILALFFWYLPLISVRFSSETLSAALLLLVLAQVMKYDKASPWQMLGIGILCGLGFEFRYQLAFAFLGLLAWGIAIKRYQWKQWLSLFAGFILVLCLAFLLDSWFYGVWVFAPYNYFNLNIVRQVAASFGVSPWYTYQILLLTVPTVLWGLAIYGSFVISIVRHYQNPAVWAFIFFIVCHSLIAHKELRFLFPVIPLLPLFMVWGYETLVGHCNRYVVRCLAVLLLLVNIGGLAAVVLKPAAYGKAAMMAFLDKEAKQNANLNVVITENSNPFYEAYLVPEIYLQAPMRLTDIAGYDFSEPGSIIVLRQGNNLNRAIVKARGRREVYRSVPKWQDMLNAVYHTYESDDVLIAYR